ncbi:MAG: DUF4864 domain-containing protein [Chthoniobacter sp.]|uniref:DUF4864 domain-containing protein n=1 Tax=Chthoniobacter sp. TaxID=2510640 RepID=UPI0032AD17AD
MSRAAKLCLLGVVFALCGAAALFQALLEHRWRSTPPAELYHVVSHQLAAFRADDFSGAYREASMGFQEKFNLEAFADLARTDYPALLRATRVEFGQTRFHGRNAFVSAYFVMPEGDIIPCVYNLVREDDAWKIDSVRVLPRWPSSRRLGGVRA